VKYPSSPEPTQTTALGQRRPLRCQGEFSLKPESISELISRLTSGRIPKFNGDFLVQRYGCDNSFSQNSDQFFERYEQVVKNALSCNDKVYFKNSLIRPSSG